MKSLPAIIALHIILATGDSTVQGYGQDNYQDQGLYGQNTGYGKKWKVPTADTKTKFNVQLNVDVGAQLDLYKKPGESAEDYYRRILAQHSYETYEEYYIRTDILKVMLPDLPIWNNFRYYDYFSFEANSVEPTVKDIYLTDIERDYSETDEQYYTRIFRKHDDENLNQYIRRMCLLRTNYPSLNVWEQNAFIKYVKPNLISNQEDSKFTFSNSPSLSSGSKILRPSSPSTSYSTIQNSALNPSSSSSYSSTINQYPSVVTSSSSPTSNPSFVTTFKPFTPASSTASSPGHTHQTGPTTASIVNSLNTPPANLPQDHWTGERKNYNKLKNLDYDSQKSKSDELYCMWLLETDRQLNNEEYDKRIENLQEVFTSKNIRENVREFCKPYVLQNKQTVVSQQAPNMHQVLPMKHLPAV